MAATDGDVPAPTGIAAVHAPGAPRRMLGRTFDSLREPDYRRLWLGMLGLWMALQFQQVARGYLAYELTGSATALGIVTLSLGLPRIVFSLAGGVLADRMPKRQLMAITLAGLALLSLLTAVLVQLAVIQIWMLVVIGLAQGTLFSFQLPARQSLIPELVSREQLANAMALNNSGMTTTRIVGPAIAGLIISIPTAGLPIAFYGVFIGYAWVLYATLRLRTPGLPASHKPGAFWSEMGAGLSYIRRTPALVALLSLGFVPIAIGMPYQNIMPVFALHVLNRGPIGLGLLLAASGVGAVVGTLFVATISQSNRKAALQLGLGIIFGLGLACFAALAARDAFLLALASLLVVGFAGDAYLALNSTLVVLNTDRRLYGRVMSMYMMTQSIRPISVLPLSILVDAIGAPLTMGGAGTIIVVFLLGVVLLYGDYGRIG